MGSYNVACSISNISIGPGEEILFFPLEKNEYRYGIGDGNHFLIGSNCFYNPVCLPIFGEYDDYGGIENIVKNDNIKVIEKFFDGIPINDICNPQETNIEPISSGMFVHKEIFDAMINNPLDEWGKNYLVNMLEKLTGFREDLKQALEKQSSLLELVSKAGASETDKKMEKLIKSGHLFMPTKGSIFEFRDYETMKEIYHQSILEGKLANDLCQFAIFDVIMYSCNAFYFPGHNGPQGGNYYMQKVVYEAAKNICNRRIKDYEDDN